VFLRKIWRRPFSGQLALPSKWLSGNPESLTGPDPISHLHTWINGLNLFIVGPSSTSFFWSMVTYLSPAKEETPSPEGPGPGQHKPNIGWGIGGRWPCTCLLCWGPESPQKADSRDEPFRELCGMGSWVRDWKEHSRTRNQQSSGTWMSQPVGCNWMCPCWASSSVPCLASSAPSYTGWQAGRWEVWLDADAGSSQRRVCQL
jgi:hypothetical protein